jgi:ATP-dependent RNA helicase SUPV3L1/SUV3
MRRDIANPPEVSMKHDELTPIGHAKSSRAPHRRAHARGKPAASGRDHRHRQGAASMAGREAKAELQTELATLLGTLLDTHGVTLLAEGGGMVTRGAIARHLGSPNLRFRAAFPAELAVPAFDGTSGAVSARLMVEGDIVRPRSLAALAAFEAQFIELFAPETRMRQLNALEHEIAAFITGHANDVPPDWRAQVHEKICQSLRFGLTWQSTARGWGVATPLGNMLHSTLARAEAERARALLHLETYENAFPLARSLRRTIHFRLGPTNSGKTHEALEKLKAAESGVYLAPLRLLAMEVRDRLTAAGVPCNLVTGEEHDIVPGARHTASTVEMMHPEHEVDVAVIDEIQMLADPARGWAWTAALVGAPARDVYVCGSPAAEALCRRAAAHLGETFSLKHLKRKTPLHLEPGPARLDALRRGDAVIAFSRKEVLTLSARLRQQGYSVATIYGALAPEVRRVEAERFARGDADIVVATDAIGMGLNLPIRRIVFSTVHKFDGEQLRKLNSSEVNQIAGRAGRFGLHEAGYVTALTAEDRRYLGTTLGAPDCFGVERLPVTASLWHVEQLASLLETDNIAEILGYFASRIAVQSPIFVADSMTTATALAGEVQRLGRWLPLATRHALSCAPVSPDKDDEATWFAHYVGALAAGLKSGLPRKPDWLRTDEPRHLAEAEMLSKNISLYAWLGFKFPEAFPEAGEVPAYRHAVSLYIERELLRQGGFGFERAAPLAA